MRYLLTTMTVVLVLLLAFGGATTAQDGSPAPTVSPSPVPLEVEPVVVPVADYWGEWDLHTLASRHRVDAAVGAAKNARSRKVGFYRQLVSVHNDELQWLANHQPEDCYASEYERWRAAVEDLHAIGKKALGFARKGNASGLKRVAKQRRVAIKELDKALSNVADCVASEPPPVSGEPFVGKWIAKEVAVLPSGFVDRSPRRLTIAKNGRMLLRIPRHFFCRESGHGLVTLSFKGRGMMVSADTPEYRWDADTYCHPKGKPRASVGQANSVPIAYDREADVLLMNYGSECYRRTRGGSPKDCTRFWRGEQPTVPAMVGLDAEAAMQALREAYLAGVPKEVFSETVPAGMVVSQGLAPGTAVDTGRSIVYSVSVGPEVDAEENDPEA